MRRITRNRDMLKRNETVAFDLLTFFEGPTLAEGVFEDRAGRTRRRFTVEMTGRAEGGTLVLDEHFLFDDGERQQRTWRLERGMGPTFTGTCEDSVGMAQGRFLQGRAALCSVLRLKVGGRPVSITFDDVFYDTGEGTVLNRSTLRKWGLRLGQVLILFRKPSQRSA
jgi:hypothetical protein